MLKRDIRSIPMSSSKAMGLSSSRTISMVSLVPPTPLGSSTVVTTVA
jgi:hypothetical protein